MKIVFLNPPVTVYDKTLHYFQATFSATAGYLRARFPQADLVVEAGGLNGTTQRSVVRHLAGDKVDFLVLWTRVWEAPAAMELARLGRELHPGVKIIVWGDATVYIPQYFRRYPVDAVVLHGDPELVLGDAIQKWSKGEWPEHGVVMRSPADSPLEGGRRGGAPSAWTETPVGRTLDPIEWPFPAVEYIDASGYRVAREHRGKLSDDLSFTISRGCPINCAAWCPTPRKEGLRDRRRPVEQTVRYMEMGSHPYELFQLHSPIFAYDKEWIDEFIERKRQVCLDVPFKSVDTLAPYEDPVLVERLAEVGLKGIGFGVESLSAQAGRKLTPKVDARLLEKVARNFRRFGLEAKAYTQIGLPGQTREDILYTHGVLLDLGYRVRPTGATPYARLRRLSVEELERMDLSRWDRKSYFEPRTGLSTAEFYRMILEPESCRWAA